MYVAATDPDVASAPGSAGDPIRHIIAEPDIHPAGTAIMAPIRTQLYCCSRRVRTAPVGVTALGESVKVRQLVERNQIEVGRDRQGLDRQARRRQMADNIQKAMLETASAKPVRQGLP